MSNWLFFKGSWPPLMSIGPGYWHLLDDFRWVCHCHCHCHSRQRTKVYVATCPLILTRRLNTFLEWSGRNPANRVQFVISWRAIFDCRSNIGKERFFVDQLQPAKSVEFLHLFPGTVDDRTGAGCAKDRFSRRSFAVQHLDVCPFLECGLLLRFKFCLC